MITKAGGKAVAVVCDVSNEEQVEACVARCVSEYGGIDVMFANAGVGGSMAPFVYQDGEDWDDVMQVNVYGVFFCLKQAVLKMKEQGRGGSIILTASVAGLRSGAGGTPYSASKAAVVSLAQSAAWQLYKTGIRVNAVCPGLIETGMTKPLFEAARAKGKGGLIGQLNPLGRPGKTTEIAEVVGFLASPAAGYVNGQAIAACGGLSASHPISKPGRVA